MSVSALVNKPLPTGDFKFQYISILPSDANQDACKMPVTIDWTQFVKENKTIVITGAPAAFSPTCSISHIPGYLEKKDELLKKADQIIVLTVDNPFAQQAWARQLGVTDTTKLKFASDAGAHFIKSLGLELDVGNGVFWSGRWALVVKDGIVTYAGKEENPATDVTVSSVDSVLAAL
ncbi:hypothetical protein Kpol_1004p59 [Vanderwaltozyma polyspora DSM 70294]|uniref:Thioredoxin domain-containing protein n=1 Tax=Vanderwaltozyma polyspora (strain ATCC 22028 / DSM 70294 / BCRC 21397 / CBS 2163 / NBRC 10782 / NRRL Y-8283 / UCD 57-17) TaxID=436907 RepID=A7TJB3_VANPO|nr:uncharacterized protein Kpol_1004p59 [Vanderwaltozyma polyspora DSM 70294]EDO17682.1 hypothetical protein Kpol_1004p59 [Vanderwaltozyma polyspora DSM 70294]